MKKQNTDTSRRDFIKQLTFVAVALPAASLILNACTKSAENTLPAGQKALSESEPLAQTLGYKQDSAQVDTTQFPKKAGPDGGSQRCETCAQYTQINSSWGKCNIFTQGLVKPEGWCNTWSAKAKT